MAQNTPIEPVDSLWVAAQAGTRKLTASERRRVLVYLDEVGETQKSNVELARIFRVSENIVREDRKRALAAVAAQLSPDHAMTFIARHIHEVDELIARARRGLNTMTAGDLGESRYLESLLKLMKERRETLENVGVIRKELGHMNISEEHWVAEVSQAGEVSVGQKVAEPDE